MPEHRDFSTRPGSEPSSSARPSAGLYRPGVALRVCFLQVMKTSLVIQVMVLTLTRLASAAEITNTFDNVPAQIQCGEAWTNQNIIQNFTETVASEDGVGGYCSFGIFPPTVALYPSRLRLDFTLLQQPVSRIETDIVDSCGHGCTVLFAYHGTNNIGQMGNTTVAMAETLALDFSNTPPDSCVIRSFEATVYEIRIFTEESPSLSILQTNGSIAVLWPATQVPYVLEKTGDFRSPSGWTTETNNIQFEGTNFVYQLSTPTGAQFFRLRRN